MKKILKKIEFWVDMNLVYFLYNGNKIHRYYDYINKKWKKNAT